MNANILHEMLLIEDKSIFKLYQEMMQIAGYFVAPVFTIGLILEYFGQMNFGAVVVKLFLITMFMGAFYEIHTTGVKLSLESASFTLQKVSPRNLFVKKWTTAKVKTTEKSDWTFIQSFAIPNLNDLTATIFFVFSKAFLWLLKLIYSSVYHLTYVFSGITAILYFLGWTKDSLKGTVQASLWCMAMPFVIVAILALVGNSIDESSISGEFVLAKMDTIVWLFGVTLLLLISPMITYTMIKGDGIHSFGSKVGAMVVSSGMKGLATFSWLSRLPEHHERASKNYYKFKGGLQRTFKKIADKTQAKEQAKQGKDTLKETRGISNGTNPRKTTQNENVNRSTSQASATKYPGAKVKSDQNSKTVTATKASEFLGRKGKSTSTSSTKVQGQTQKNSSEVKEQHRTPFRQHTEVKRDFRPNNTTKTPQQQSKITPRRTINELR
ncbi:MAG: hypothetical protein HYV97_03605 [Bdellovibrio sp.]|nr:hypothetical protein [Bdellovibrio sp.]